jgi:hypothetical protein
MFGAVEAQTADIVERASISEPYLLAISPTFGHGVSKVVILSRAEERSL